jgi:hypothetical protein
MSRRLERSGALPNGNLSRLSASSVAPFKTPKDALERSGRYPAAWPPFAPWGSATTSAPLKILRLEQPLDSSTCVHSLAISSNVSRHISPRDAIVAPPRAVTLSS